MESENKSSKKGWFIGGGIALCVISTLFIMYAVTSNSEVRLKNQAGAQEQICKNNFDNMFKTIAQTAQVSEQYKESFKEIYLPLIEGRYKDNNLLMKWVTESNPNFDTKLYDKLVDVIESKRNGFELQQNKLVSIVQEHNNLLETMPSSWFVGGRPHLNVTYITSAKTKEVYRTGEDNDIDLFPKK
jgi:hypothetical protein